jgi:hypothetical protein
MREVEFTTWREKVWWGEEMAGVGRKEGSFLEAEGSFRRE